MARADRRQAARQARRVERRPSAASGGAGLAEDTMFFPRLRSHARWVFVLLVIVFGAGFVLLGVGSGTSGLTDVLQGNFGDLFGSSTGSSAQAKKDRDRIKKNPKDYAAYKDLASALAADGKTDEAIATLQQLKAVNPKDVDGLTQLAVLYLSKASQVQTEGQAIQAVLGEPDQLERLRARRDDEARQGVPGAQRPHRHAHPGRREREAQHASTGS